MCGFRFNDVTLPKNLGNIFQIACDFHFWQAVDEIAAVGFCSEAAVKNGNDAFVGLAANQTPDALFECDNGLRNAVIEERFAAVLVNKTAACSDNRVGRNSKRQFVDYDARKLFAAHVNSLPKAGSRK